MSAVARSLAAAALATVACAASVHAAGDLQFYLHRDFSLDAVAPTAGDDATLEFGVLSPTTVRFAAAPAQRPWSLLGDASFHTSMASETSVGGRFDALLDVDGRPAATSDGRDFLVGFRAEDVVLAFDHLNVTVPAGGVLGVTLRMDPLLKANVTPVGGPEVALGNLRVQVLYDSTAHPGGFDYRPQAADGGPGASGGPGSGPGGNGGGNGGNGAEGGSGNGGTGALLAPLAAAGIDPVVGLLGVGTSVLALVGGIALRRP